MSVCPCGSNNYVWIVYLLLSKCAVCGEIIKPKNNGGKEVNYKVLDGENIENFYINVISGKQHVCACGKEFKANKDYPGWFGLGQICSVPPSYNELVLNHEKVLFYAVHCPECGAKIKKCIDKLKKKQPTPAVTPAVKGGKRGKG